MSLKDIISTLFWIIIGVLVSFASIKLNIGDVKHPGPGFMSFYAGLILIFLTLLMAGSKIKKGRDTKSVSFAQAINVNFVIVLCSLFGFALILNFLGFLVSIGLFVFVLLKITAKKKWLTPLLWSIGVSLVTYFVFSVLLKCNLPLGILDWR